MTGGPSSPARWIATFLDAQAAELGAATNTQLAYGRDLKDFADWLAGRGGDFARANREMIENYLIDCDAQGLAKSTRARRLSAIRQIYRFAFDEGWRSDNPAIQIRGPGRACRKPWMCPRSTGCWPPPAAPGATRPTACATPA